MRGLKNSGFTCMITSTGSQCCVLMGFLIGWTCILSPDIMTIRTLGTVGQGRTGSAAWFSVSSAHGRVEPGVLFFSDFYWIFVEIV